MERSDILSNVRFIVILVLVGIGMLFWTLDNAYKRDEKYPMIRTGDALNDRVTLAETNRGVVRLETSSGKKLRLPWAFNMNYEEDNICNSVSIGDSIIKIAQSDTIKIRKQDGVRVFVAETSIEKVK
jgi:hypothetical protein